MKKANCKHYKFPQITKQHRKNLRKLAKYLDEVVSKQPRHTFNMDRYSNSMFSMVPVNLSYKNTVDYVCGTVACAVGHAPKLFRIKDSDWDKYWNEKHGFNWYRFQHRLFGVSSSSITTELSAVTIHEVWAWLFDSYWKNIDNTPQGAAARIRYFTKFGLPITFKDQLEGNAPLCYKTEDK